MFPGILLDESLMHLANIDGTAISGNISPERQTLMKCKIVTLKCISLCWDYTGKPAKRCKQYLCGKLCFVTQERSEIYSKYKNKIHRKLLAAKKECRKLSTEEWKTSSQVVILFKYITYRKVFNEKFNFQFLFH